jgi:hypothetical protein
LKRIAYLLLLLFGATTSAFGVTLALQDDPNEIKAKQVIAKTQERQEDILRKQLDKPYPGSGFWHDEDFAFGAYYFNQSKGLAEDGLARVRNSFINTAPDDVFWETGAHWHVYLLARLYWMYSSKSATPRMSKVIENYLADIMYAYLTNSKYVGKNMVDYNFIWTYKGSENHHLQAYVSAWSAAHILKDLPEYKDMKIGDIGLSQFTQEFDSYFKLYFREKATKGLLTEIASPTYVKYSLNTLYNIYDFTDDAELKKLADMFLNLYIADWAIEQFDGLRGGSKHRSYTGSSSYELASSVGWFAFGLGSPTKHPGFTSAATTTWRPDVLVAELALAQKDRGTYEVVSRRPGLRRPGTSGNEANPGGGQLLRYTYHTPEFIMGMSMLPALSYDAWVAISSQNRCNQILFNGTPAKIFTQRYTPEAGSVYNAEWGVQHKGVMILQMLPEPLSHSAKGQLVFFSKSLNLVEEGGWVFAEADSAYCAVKVVQGNAMLRHPVKEDYRDGQGDLNAGTYLELEDSASPIVFEVAPKESYSSFEAFQEEIQNNTLAENDAVLTYYSKAYQDTLTLYTDYSQLPEINGTPVNLNPDFVYQSPFINGNFGQSVVTISMGDKNLVLDFDLKTIKSEEHVTICPKEEYKGWTKPGSYQSSYISSSGNDSILTTHLTVASFKPTLVMNGNTLSSNEVYTAYQWFYSAGPIPGATNPDYKIKWSGEYYLEATNEAGCTSRSDTTFYKLTTSNNIEFEKFVYSIMPNPVNGIFNFRFDSNPPKKISLKLINSLGQTIEQRDIKNPAINQMEYFNVSYLKRGIYYLILSDEKNKSSKKIIKL